MANWVINRLTFIGDDVTSVIKQHLTKAQNGDLCFDFNTVIPMPKDLDIETGSRSMDGIKLYLGTLNPLVPNLGNEEEKMDIRDFAQLVLDNFGEQAADHLNRYIIRPSEVADLKEKYKDQFDDVVELGKKQMENVQKYGAPNWYEWSLQNWGCKWNSSETSVADNSVYFSTPWAPSIQLVNRLAKMHPNLTIIHDYAEEQGALITGSNTYCKGKMQERNDFDAFSKEAYEMYFDLWGGNEEYKFDKEKNNYVRKDDCECEM